MSDMTEVETRTMAFADVRLAHGETLPELRLAYETYGRLAGDGRNAVLITHGYTSHHHAGGRYAAGKAPAGITEPGWWDTLIGPGKPIDTERYFVVSSNTLGSSFGSTGPAGIDPRTSKPYGPTFPRITMSDMVAAQKRLVDALGVKRLAAVAGQSYGGYQAFQWAVQYPDFVDRIVASVTAPKGRGGADLVTDLVADLARDPNWNDGWYYDRGGIVETLTRMRITTLKLYGADEALAASVPDPREREQAIRKLAEPWAKAFDGHSLVVLRRAAVEFDTTADLERIRSRVLYVLSTTDKLFPPSLAPGVMAALKSAGVDATYFELQSDKGHLASGQDAAKWAPALRAFLER